MTAADIVLATRIVALLNELVESDRPAVASLINNRVPCNEALANHPTVQTGEAHGGYNVGMLGILNGLCGEPYANGGGPIAAVFEDPDTGIGFANLSGFKTMSEADYEPVADPDPDEAEGEA